MLMKRRQTLSSIQTKWVKGAMASFDQWPQIKIHGTQLDVQMTETLVEGNSEDQGKTSGE
jgi:hypothetical protein